MLSDLEFYFSKENLRPAWKRLKRSSERDVIHHFLLKFPLFHFPKAFFNLITLVS